MIKTASRVIHSMATDKHNNPELVRIITLVGAVACLIVFVESNVYYALTVKPYDLTVVGEFMDKFANSFAWIVGAGAAGISARSYVDRGRGPRQQQQGEVVVDAEH